jgi:hypothetical protein
MAWYNPSWLYRKKITIDQTKIDANLTDFPVYIKMADLGSDFFSLVQSDGEDIVVTAADGSTKLKRELVAINTGAQTGELWFKGSSISGTVDTEFYVYYGNPAATETNDTDTWRSEFSSVHHLNDLTTSTTNDSTSNNFDGTKTSANNPLEANAKIGKGQTISGDLINIGDGTALDFGTGEFAVFAWAISNATADNFFIAGKQENAGNFDGFNMGAVITTGYGQAVFRSAATNYVAASTVNLYDNVYHRCVMVRRSTGLYLYVDGVQVASQLDTNTQNNEDNADGLVIGDGRSGVANAGSGAQWPGTIDEFFVWKGTAPSDAWLKADYENQNNTATFYTVAAQEATTTTSTTTSTTTTSTSSSTSTTTTSTSTTTTSTSTTSTSSSTTTTSTSTTTTSTSTTTTSTSSSSSSSTSSSTTVTFPFRFTVDTGTR